MLLIRQTVLYLPAQVFGPLCQFAAAVGWTHYLAPADYGVAAYLIAAQDLALILTMQWWSLFTGRFFQRFQRSGGLEDYAQTDLALVLVGSALQIPAAAIVMLSLGVFTWSFFAATSLYFITRVALNHYSERARASERIAVYTIAQTASSVVGSLMSFPVLLYVSQTPEALIWTFVLPQALALAVIVRLLGVPRRIVKIDRAMVSAGLVYGLPLVASCLFIWVCQNGIRFVVEQWGGLAAVGLVSVGWGLAMRLASVVSMIGAAAAFPRAVAHFEAGKIEVALDHIAMGGALLFGLLAPAVAGMFMISAQVAELFVAETFRPVTQVILPVALLAAAIRSMRVHFFDQVGLLRERTRATLMVNALDATTSMIGCTIGVILGGIEGAALGSLLAAIVPLGLSASLAMRMKLRIPVGTLVRTAIAAAVMVGVMRLLPTGTGIGGLILSILTGASAYGVAMGLLFLRELRQQFTVAA